MTVNELIQDLQRFPGHFRVIFTPRELCGGGMPEWADARCKRDFTYGPNDEEVLQDRVIVKLDGEIDE